MSNGGERLLTFSEDSLRIFSVEVRVFLGIDGQECEEFIRAIHNAAYAEGKIRDNAWMADLALTYFSGRALRYYDSLEPEVKSDWSLLRQALLARYSPLDDDENETQPRGWRYETKYL